MVYTYTIYVYMKERKEEHREVSDHGWVGSHPNPNLTGRRFKKKKKSPPWSDRLKTSGQPHNVWTAVSFLFPFKTLADHRKEKKPKNPSNSVKSSSESPRRMQQSLPTARPSPTWKPRCPRGQPGAPRLMDPAHNLCQCLFSLPGAAGSSGSPATGHMEGFATSRGLLL